MSDDEIVQGEVVEVPRSTTSMSLGASARDAQAMLVDKLMAGEVEIRHGADFASAIKALTSVREASNDDARLGIELSREDVMAELAELRGHPTITQLGSDVDSLRPGPVREVPTPMGDE